MIHSKNKVEKAILMPLNEHELSVADKKVLSTQDAFNNYKSVYFASEVALFAFSGSALFSENIKQSDQIGDVKAIFYLTFISLILFLLFLTATFINEVIDLESYIYKKQKRKTKLSVVRFITPHLFFGMSGIAFSIAVFVSIKVVSNI